MSGAGSGVAGRSSLQDPRDSRRSEAHLRRRTGERRGSVAFVYPLGVDVPESAASLKGGRPRRKYHAVPLLTNAFSASVSMANGGSVLVEVTGRGVPIMGSAMTSSVSVGVRLDRTPCMALRTACRPRSICFSKRYRFSIMCSFGQVTSSPTRIILSSSAGSGSLRIRNQSKGRVFGHIVTAPSNRWRKTLDQS